jgi:predicted PurR-regulated permease PerM
MFALILVPALILYVSSLNSQTETLLSNVSKREHIVGEAKRLPSLKKQLDEGLISEEEWQELIKQLNWRHYEKLINDIWLVIYSKTRRWLALLIGLTSLVLLLSFFLY